MAEVVARPEYVIEPLAPMMLRPEGTVKGPEMESDEVAAEATPEAEVPYKIWEEEIADVVARP
jgi:hypothetical protein